MKRIYRILLVALLALTSFITCVSIDRNGYENDYVRTIYIEENKYDIDEILQKYNLLEDAVENVLVSEMSKEELLSHTSTESFIYEYNIFVCKKESFFIFEYRVILSNEIIHQSSTKVNVVCYDGYYYFESEYGITSFEDAYNRVLEECDLSFACFDDVLNLASPSSLLGGMGSGGSLCGNALGLGLALGIGKGLEATSGCSGHLISGGSSKSKPIADDPIDQLLDSNPNLIDELNAIGKTKDELEECLNTFLKMSGGIATLSILFNTDNKVLCLGKDIYDKESNKHYYIYSKNNSFWAFYTENYEEIVEKYTKKLIELANKALINYCCVNDWDFIFVTNPYCYMEEHKSLTEDSAYCKEIAIIRSYDYNRFITGPSSWSEILPAGPFDFAGYRVSK